ncbi:MAG: type II and III secretion system protein, partial [Verrucomicrobiia bacterium]
ALTQRNNRKLDEIIIPLVAFIDTTVREALDFLKQESVRRDPNPPEPGRPKGLNIVLDVAGEVEPAATEGEATFDSASLAATPITIDLSEVPLRVALEYVTNLAGLKFKVEPYAILVVPQSSTRGDTLLNKEYRVRADFLSMPVDTGGAAAPVNPLSGAGAPATGAPTARAILEANGVTFPPGASATYFPSTSRLVVRNTQANLDVVDNIIANMEVDTPKQITVESKFVEITQTDLKELSFDWLVGAADVDGNGRVFTGGGTAGPARLAAPNNIRNEFPFIDPVTGQPAGGTLSTGGLRSGSGGSNAISLNAIDTLLNAAAGGISPGTFSVAGILTDPTFQVVVRALDQKKGVDLLTAPRVTTKSGQRAIVEIIREFRYPTEFDPPQVPTGNGVNLVVTPTTPTTFETRNVGVTLEVEPTVSADNYTIELALTPTVVEFEGFVNYGTPIFAPDLVTGGRIQLTENVINQPIFGTRRVTTSVTIWDGQTVVLGGLMREDVQKVDDKIPLLGDIPLVGRAFRSKVDSHVKRNLVIFVTATLIDPAGQNLRLTSAEERILTDGQRGNLIDLESDMALPGASEVPIE